MTWYLWLLLIGVYGFILITLLAFLFGAHILEDEGRDE